MPLICFNDRRNVIVCNCMPVMRVLYYYWGENSKEDCVECMQHLGWKIDIFQLQARDLTRDDDFKDKLRASLHHDFIFSFDYFPLISEVAQDIGIPYISWVYDSPHLTLQSKTLGNSCNHVFIFDYGLVEQYKREGFDTVDYMPLGCNIRRLERISHKTGSHNITFLGSLYNDENNLYDQITYLPDYLKGYLDAIILSQEHIYGMDLPSELITEELCSEMAKYIHADLGDNYRSSQNEILRGMLRKKVTVNERYNILKILGEHFPDSVDLYAPVAPPSSIHVNYKGYADYRNKMPRIFASSSINLNITLRSIQTGIPLRVIDILGVGGFVLTNYQAELPQYFEYGQDIVWYESKEDLLEKCAYYLDHESERTEITRKGHEIAKREFDYEVLLPRIFIA